MKSTDQQGFSFIDLMIAITVMLVGILALGGVLTAAIVNTTELEYQMRAKEHAASTLEAIYSVRDISKLGFDAAQNVTPAYGSTPGIFVNGRTAIRTDAGVDGIIGTADDSGSVVPDYQRTIVIRPPEGADASQYKSLRQVDVTIFYKVRGVDRQITLSAYIGNYRQVN